MKFHTAMTMPTPNQSATPTYARIRMDRSAI
jgi:hypothetical protein